MASRTALRCDSIVSLHSFGTLEAYETRQYALTATFCLVKLAAMEHQPTGTPRWVKVFALVAIVLIALVAVMLIAGGGEHGPGRHTSAGEAQAATWR